MKFLLETSTKEQYDAFKNTLGKTTTSNNFNDFVSAMYNV